MGRFIDLSGQQFGKYVVISRGDAEQRRRAKVVNFGIVYGLTPFGLSPFGLSQTLGTDTNGKWVSKALEAK